MADVADSVGKILDGLSKVAWPLLAVFVVWQFYPVLIRVFQSRAFTVKVGEMQISVQEASEQLTKQIKDLQDKVAALENAALSAAAERRSAGPVLAEPQQVPPGVTILWVDDKPANNAYEIARLRDEDAKVLTATSTDEALRVLSAEQVTAIISDMGRQEPGGFNRTAGLDLLRRLREAGTHPPLYFYSTAKALRQYETEIAALGGQGTASPVELLRLLKSQVGGPA